HGTAPAGLVLGQVGCAGRLHGAARHFLGSRQHLVHGGSDLTDLGLLPFHVASTVVGQAGHARALAIGLVGSLPHPANHLAHLPQQTVVGGGDHAHFVI